MQLNFNEKLVALLFLTQFPKKDNCPVTVVNYIYVALYAVLMNLSIQKHDKR